MNTYLAIFTGRKKNAIGVCYTIRCGVLAENEDDALLKLYDKYEHIYQPKFELMNGAKNGGTL